MADFSLVVPLFNEAGSVAPLYREIGEVCLGSLENAEIIFVDDGSLDATFEELRRLARLDPRVRAVRLARNSGQTAALQAGFDLSRGSVIVTMDGDRQNDPRDIPKLLNAISSGADIVCGWRRWRSGDRWSRVAPSKIANWIVRRLTRLKVHDHGCGLKAFRREVVSRQGIYSDMHRLMVPFVSAEGLWVEEVEVAHRRREHGRSKYGAERIWKVTLDLFGVVLIGRYRANPGRYFGYWSLPFVALAAIAVGASLYQYWTRGSGDAQSIVWPGIALLASFASLHFVSLACLGELVRAIPQGTIWTRASGPEGVEEIVP